MLPPYPKSTMSGSPTDASPTGAFPTSVIPTGVFPPGGFSTGVFPPGGFSTGVFPPGGFPTGSPKHTGPHGTGHHKSVYPTDKPILPRHRSHTSFTGGFPMPTGSLPSMPSDDPVLSSLLSEHFSEPFTRGPHPTGEPSLSQRRAFAPFSPESGSGEMTETWSSEPHAHRTGTHPRPTGAKPSGAVGYPKGSKQY